MKQRINGITYDTDRSEQMIELKPESPNHADMYQTRSGHFFVAEHRFYVKGRKVPDSTPFWEFHRKCIIPGQGGSRYRLAQDVEERVTIVPIPRREALGLAIRHILPRTFHKDLARFLK